MSEKIDKIDTPKSDVKTANLTYIVQKATIQTQNLERIINELGRKASLLGSQVQEAEKRRKTLEQAITEQDSQLRLLNSRLQVATNHKRGLEHELIQMQRSIARQLVMRYHNCIVERALPHGTGRRDVYDKGLQGCRILSNEGWRSLWFNYKRYQIYKKNKMPYEEQKENSFFDSLALEIPPSKSMKEKFKSFLSHNNGRLSFPNLNEPEVSIIILTFNKSEYTYQCLESIIKYTDIPYELILVDNGSTDETLSFFDRIDNALIIKNKENLGFVKGCNQGAMSAKGKYLMFLNNDTLVTSGWLSNLVKTIEGYTGCGAVGCKLIWPNGRLQEAGSIIWAEGIAQGYGRGDDPKKPEYSYLREVDYCSGACLLVRKDLFENLGRFDERYVPSYYEDSDLCLGIWNLGYKVVYQPDVTVIHYEYTSSGSQNAGTLMEANHIKFLNKWESTLKDRPQSSNTGLLSLRDRRAGKKMLVIDDTIPAPHLGRGYPRAHHMLNFLADIGYVVTFFPLIDPTQRQPYTHQYQQSGVELFFGENLDFEEFSASRSDHYDLVLVSRPHNMKRVRDIIRRNFAGAILIYDAEALYSMREYLKAKTNGFIIDEEKFENMIREEIGLMQNSNLIMAVSENEKRMIEARGVNNIAIWGHPVNVSSSENTFDERKDILFIGALSDPDSPNVDAISYFIKDIFPRVQSVLQCKLYIVGINPPESIGKLASNSIIVTGYVEDLKEYYNKCRIFIVPHRYSAGIPLKLVEAMSYGIPAVVSELTANQLQLTDGHEFLMAKDPVEFANKVIRLYEDKELWLSIQKNAIEYIKSNCDPGVMRIKLKNIIESVF